MILRHMQTAKDWHIEDNERGKKLTIFPTEGRKERGGRCKGWTCLRMKQISLTLNSDYSVVKIPLTTGLDNYPERRLPHTFPSQVRVTVEKS